MNDLKNKILDLRSFVDLRNLDLSTLGLITTNKNLIYDIHQPAGVEHYRLLCLLSTWFNHITIFEIGTWLGAGALCLAYNKSNNVVTYDINNNVDIQIPANVKTCIGDYKRDAELLKSPFIFVDLDHTGKNEKEIYQYLIANKYIGFTVWNAISLNNEMRNFWQDVKFFKYDITRYGHYSGTGIIFFE